MAKNANDEPVEPTSSSNRNRLRTVGRIAGGVLALGATFAAGSAVGHVGDGPRGGGPAVGQSGEREHGAGEGKYTMDRDHEYEVGEEMHGPRGGNHGHGQVHGTVPAPGVTP